LPRIVATTSEPTCRSSTVNGGTAVTEGAAREQGHAGRWRHLLVSPGTCTPARHSVAAGRRWRTRDLRRPRSRRTSFEVKVASRSTSRLTCGAQLQLVLGRFRRRRLRRGERVQRRPSAWDSPRSRRGPRPRHAAAALPVARTRARPASSFSSSKART
jgi:hypothetical protein